MCGCFARYLGIPLLYQVISLPIGLEEHFNAVRVLSQLKIGGNSPGNRRNRASREVLVPRRAQELDSI